ncbi:hypothetical protein PHLGIDRAFT_237426 [Phlebiopsis gigantea 11061_1 CR5-6]|uniref:Uncharacterized protein n=1 Tax=Phlebiopsis gigantea (strain 11061_1 CR5-6) TaxID=745531 RepID=A0A0C3S5F3_PHLG1|nr:hypothetical protein PHLGIDRAFT_237426 [Phlebiopsis gigantea 11061_1 CR5-6]
MGRTPTLVSISGSRAGMRKCCGCSQQSSRATCVRQTTRQARLLSLAGMRPTVWRHIQKIGHGAKFTCILHPDLPGLMQARTVVQRLRSPRVVRGIRSAGRGDGMAHVTADDASGATRVKTIRTLGLLTTAFDLPPPPLWRVHIFYRSGKLEVVEVDGSLEPGIRIFRDAVLFSARDRKDRDEEVDTALSFPTPRGIILGSFTSPCQGRWPIHTICVVGYLVRLQRAEGLVFHDGQNLVKLDHVNDTVVVFVAGAERGPIQPLSSLLHHVVNQPHEAGSS